MVWDACFPLLDCFKFLLHTLYEEEESDNNFASDCYYISSSNLSFATNTDEHQKGAHYYHGEEWSYSLHW